MPLRAGSLGRSGLISVALFAPLMCAGLVASVRPAPPAAPAAADPAASPEFYTARVQPIFQANCYRCHAGLNHRGGLQLDSAAAMMKGGHDGAVLVPGHPEQSLLIKLIRHEGPANDPMPMPPKSKLSDSDIATVEQWVRAGAVMPSDTGTK
jgi:cytochrome c